MVLGYADDGHTVVIRCVAIDEAQVCHALLEVEAMLADVTFPADAVMQAYCQFGVKEQTVGRDIIKFIMFPVVRQVEYRPLVVRCSTGGAERDIFTWRTHTVGKFAGCVLSP